MVLENKSRHFPIFPVMESFSVGCSIVCCTVSFLCSSIVERCVVLNALVSKRILLGFWEIVCPAPEEYLSEFSDNTWRLCCVHTHRHNLKAAQSILVSISVFHVVVVIVAVVCSSCFCFVPPPPVNSNISFCQSVLGRYQNTEGDRSDKHSAFISLQERKEIKDRTTVYLYTASKTTTGLFRILRTRKEKRIHDNVSSSQGLLLPNTFVVAFGLHPIGDKSSSGISSTIRGQNDVFDWGETNDCPKRT